MYMWVFSLVWWCVLLFCSRRFRSSTLTRALLARIFWCKLFFKLWMFILWVWISFGICYWVELCVFFFLCFYFLFLWRVFRFARVVVFFRWFCLVCLLWVCWCCMWVWWWVVMVLILWMCVWMWRWFCVENMWCWLVLEEWIELRGTSGRNVLGCEFSDCECCGGICGVYECSGDVVSGVGYWKVCVCESVGWRLCSIIRLRV